MNVKFTNTLIYNTEKRQFVSGTLCVSDGIIVGGLADDAAFETIDLKGRRMIPGMIDMHTHGHGGYESTVVDADGMKKMAESYAGIGTTSFMVTMMSQPLDILESCIDITSEVKKSGCRNILGVYLEGRYISLAKKGAHDPKYIAAPDADELESLIRRADGAGVFCTICAPDIEGTKELVERARELGASVSIGHTNATYEECVECVGWGAGSYTHLFNGMSGFTHRAPGCAGAALSGDTYVELICDGVHVAPAAVKVAYRARAEKLILITDSAPAAGLPAGHYSMGGADVVVRDGAVYLSDGTLTGGSISLFEAMMNLTKFAGITLEEAIPTATKHPAEFLGVYDSVGSLDIGKRADFIILDDKNDISEIYTGGVRV